MLKFRFKGSEAEQLQQVDDLRVQVQRHIFNIEGAMTERWDKWQGYINQYKALLRTKDKKFPWPGCSNIFVPVMANHITTISSFIMASRFKTGPAIKVKNYFADDADTCGELENFIDYYQTAIQRIRPYWRKHLPYTLLLGTHISKQIYKVDPVTKWAYAKPTGISLFH